jgi:hypothetical protein
MFLGNVGYIIKDISHLSLGGVKYIVINRELVLYLDLLVLKEGRDAIYKRARICELNYI